MRRQLVMCAFAFATTSCANAGGIQSALNPQGPAARSIFTLMTWLFGVCALVYVVVIFVTAWAVWRRRQQQDVAPAFERRTTRVITVATIATTVILVGFVTATALTEHGLMTRNGPGAITVDVSGHQWWWDFQYRNVSPDAWVTSPNELHVPVGVPVVIRLAATDVIHSFWVPNLQGKRDLIPGQVTDTWIQADRPGIYRGQCAEFCGYQHANMSFFVVAEPIAQFERWIQNQRTEAAQPATPDEQHGRELFLSSH